MKLFELYAAVAGWHDGDTFYGALDQGFGIYRATGIDVEGGKIVLKPARHRCYGINAPELRVGGRSNPAGLDALAFAAQLVPTGVYPALSYPPMVDDFGRPLIDLILPGDVLFSQAMIDSGHAVQYIP